ncbi:hypothetical protein OSB04_008973 [Centaurea solstitialis]|uniref:F-box domain-containing protein n=1 Tax=Centaurea solstitialis TaxID=347529 RepID=A0AA38U7B5_9ASTR|nr:hypothetical protein OSB04_008973 [Centaurea solstitialis]
MENTNIPDDVVSNILSRLSAKPLMRFRCASKHWNSLITDPGFINSRSRRMILMPSGLTGLYAYDPKHRDIVKLTYPFEHQIYKCKIIGTLSNGVVILVLEKHYFGPRTCILYNPLTRATKKLFDLPRPCCDADAEECAYGFGQGNIIIINHECYNPSRNEHNKCNIFSLKTGAWTVPKTTFTVGGESGFFVDNVGLFLNGFLHWIEYVCIEHMFSILVFDVTEMVLTRMDGPRVLVDGYNQKSSVLGMLHGRLCLSNMWSNGFDVWVKEHSEWSKQYSFALPFYQNGCPNYLDLCILEEGRILVKDGVSNQIIMCHLFEDYYDIFKCASEIRVISRYGIDGSGHDFGKPVEYVESLVSPSDIYHV